MRFGHTAALLLVSLAAVSVAYSDSILPPRRPLAHEDIVDISAGSDGVVIGCVQELQTRFIPSGHTPNAGRLRYTIVVGCLEWLNGESTHDTIRVEYSPMRFYDTNPLAESPSADTQFLFILRRHPKLPPGISIQEFGDPSIDWEWTLQQSPYYLSQGMLPIEGTDSSVEVTEVKKAIESHSLEALAQRAEVIVVGTFAGAFDSVETESGQMRCPIFAVSEAIVPSSVADSILVCAVVPGLGPRNESLLFLRRISGVAYETISFGTGAWDIENGVIVRTGEPVEHVVAAIREVLARTDADR